MCDHVFTLAKKYLYIYIYIYIYLQLYYYLQHTRFAFYNVNQVETHSLLLKKVRGKEKKIRSKLRRWNHGKTSVKFCIVCGLRAESNSYSFRSQSNIVTWMWVAHEFFFFQGRCWICRTCRCRQNLKILWYLWAGLNFIFDDCKGL